MQILDSIDALKKMPLMGRIGRKPNTRELGMTGLPFITIYRVREDVIEILRILHGAQKWP
jgi:plasmid stabilization system protein ParE